MTYKISCNIIKQSLFSCYTFISVKSSFFKIYWIDLYCKIKYFVFFIMFLNSALINYMYYKCFHKTNNKLISALSYTINLNGCIIIKLIQWTSNQLLFIKNSPNNNKFLNQIFSRYYENCYIHSLNYTKSLFYKDFEIEFDDFFELDNNFTIKSGSIAQVYKANFKNKNLYTNSPIAIKVIHPEISYQFIYPIIFLKIYKFFVSNFKCLNKYDTIYNFDTFFINLKKQINMISEYSNNELFYNKYYNHNVIVIPKPLMKSTNFLIMEYIEGEIFETLNISNYKKQIIICLIALFIKDTYIFGNYVHADLHDANWKIAIQHSQDSAEPSYKIIIYDFGYVVENSLNETVKLLTYYLDINNVYELGKLLFSEVQNLDVDYSNSKELELCREKFIDEFVKYNKQIYPYTDSNYIAAYNFCYNNGYKLNNNVLDLFISTMLLHKYFKKYVFSSFIQENSMFNQVNYYKYIYNINLYYVSICEKYNVFHNVKTFITQQYINNPIFINVIDYNNNYFDTLPNSANSYIAIDI
jgi:predicted unusual protein kinase regulating ubiquinone biosynthesis (AarF/ABC1/UbiB family)